MAHIIIKDLEQNRELTSKALASISGGMYTAPQGELLGNLLGQPVGEHCWNPCAPYPYPYQPINLVAYSKTQFAYSHEQFISIGGYPAPYGVPVA